jgi:hypothetical protein
MNITVFYIIVGVVSSVVCTTLGYSYTDGEYWLISAPWIATAILGANFVDRD